MKKWYLGFILLFGHLLALQSQPEPGFCPTCCADMVYNVDGCTFSAFPLYSGGDHSWTISPGDIHLNQMEIFGLQLGPGRYQLTHQVICDDSDDVFKEIVNFTIDCNQCPLDPAALNIMVQNLPDKDCAFRFKPKLSQTIGFNHEYSWTFENGTPATSDILQPTVAFPVGTEYAEVCLTLRVPIDDGEYCEIEKCEIINIDCIDYCTYFDANFDYTLDDCTITLNGSASTGGEDHDISFFNYTIDGVSDFGLWGFGPPPSSLNYNFSSNGIYEICLNVTGQINPGQDLCHDQECVDVLVTDCAEGCIDPTISPFIFEVNPNEDEVPCSYKEFYVAQSPWPNSECVPFNYYVDFGDGTFCDYTAGECTVGSYPKRIAHEYSENGVYNVCVYAFDQCGCYNYYCTTVYVNCPSECQASIQVNCPSPFAETADKKLICDIGVPGGCNGCFLSVSTPSTGAQIISWEWNMYRISDDFHYGSVTTNFVRACWPEDVPIRLCLEIVDSNGCTDEHCLEFNSCLHGGVKRSSGEESLLSRKSLSVSPNPSSDFFNIEISDQILSVRIMDVQGRVAREYAGNQQATMTIPTNGLNNGAYWLSVTTADEIFSEKIIIIR